MKGMEWRAGRLERGMIDLGDLGEWEREGGRGEERRGGEEGEGRRGYINEEAEQSRM
jgi:hypothetical protein